MLRKLRFTVVTVTSVSLLFAGSLVAGCSLDRTYYVYDRVTSKRTGEPTLVLVKTESELDEPTPLKSTRAVTQKEYDNCPRRAEYPKCADAVN